MNSAQTPQLTFRAVLLAIVLAMILSAANAYLGLFAGLTIATAIPAAHRTQFDGEDLILTTLLSGWETQRPRPTGASRKGIDLNGPTVLARMPA